MGLVFREAAGTSFDSYPLGLTRFDLPEFQRDVLFNGAVVVLEIRLQVGVSHVQF